jgi:hypothetical protein
MAARVHFETVATGGGGGSGTVTNVSALTIGTAGTNLSSTVVSSTTTPVITLNVPTASAVNRGALSSADWSTFNSKQSLLVSGTNIKTVNSTSLLGSGNLAVQEILVSGTNIKTVNGNSLLGSGNLVISGGGTPSGVAGSVQFSDGTNFASDNANFFWDDTNNRLGVGTNSPTARTHIVGIDQLSTSTSLLVQDSIGTNILRVHNQANNSAVVMSTAKIANYEIISGDVLFNTSMRFIPTTGGVAINKDYSSASSNTLVHLKGSGSTSATTALLVQNSAGTSALTIKDNLSATFGGALTSSSSITTTATLQGGNINAVNILYIGNYQSSLKSNGSGIIQLQNTAENDFSRLQFGGATSSFPSLKRNGTAIDVRLADDSNYALLNTGATFIKGSGSTSATNALLVQNSAGTALLTIRDDGVATFGSAILASSFTGNLRTDFINTSNNAYTVLQTNPANGNGKFYESVSIGTFTDPVASAALDVVSTTKGFLPPRMTTAQINAIATPAAGLMAFNLDIGQVCVYDGAIWHKLNQSIM